MSGMSLGAYASVNPSYSVIDMVPAHRSMPPEETFIDSVATALTTSSAAMASEESLGDRFIRVLTTPIDVVFGAIWLISTIYQTVRLFSGADEATCDTDDKIAQLHKQAFKDGASFIGNAANVTTWLHGVKILSLDSLFLSICQNLGMGISLTMGWINMMNAATTISECDRQLETPGLTEVQKEVLCHKKAAAIVNLSAQLCYVIWAILSIIAICFSVVFPPLLLFGFLSLGLIGTVVGFVCDLYATGIEHINLEPPAYLRT